MIKRHLFGYVIFRIKQVGAFKGREKLKFFCFSIPLHPTNLITMVN